MRFLQKNPRLTNTLEFPRSNRLVLKAPKKGQPDNMEASANVTREEFNTAIGDISAKMETLMTTMSQLVQGAAPTAGDGRESRGGRHTAPGSNQGGLDRAPNTREAPSW